ncbi:hypothetical protein HK102_001765 [Quaeritorhiza haematococci]|nr:hypothetical protein HK102_001765 [Quaeritorhiza haematococci]
MSVAVEINVETPFTHNTSDATLAINSPISSNDLLAEVQRNILAYACFDQKRLTNLYPPKIKCSKKKKIHQKIVTRASLAALEDPIHLLRLRGICFTKTVSVTPIEEVSRTSFYKYEDESTDSTMVWYVSPADRSLFGWYGKENLFASEEVKAMEFPVVCSLRECMNAMAENKKCGDGNKRYSEILPKTIFEQATSIGAPNAGQPTPVLIMNAKQLCEIDTRTIYGDAFRTASIDHILKCVTPLTDNNRRPRSVNFICMEALQRDRIRQLRTGAYNVHQLRSLLRIALTAFAGAVSVTKSMGKEKTVIHTANWGCGVYKNHKSVIAFIQTLAARIAGVQELIYHHTEAESDSVEAGKAALRDMLPSDSEASIDLEDFLYKAQRYLEERNWGWVE